MGIPYAEVIGDPIAHSKSPLIHKFWLEKLGMVGDYRAVRVAPSELKDYFASRRADPDWRGCNVTAPHKIAALPLLDTITRSSRAIGAVNTIRRDEEGRMHGRNSDIHGVWRSLDHIHKDIKSVLIVGAGGAARAAAYAISKFEGANVQVMNRTEARAKNLVYDFRLSGYTTMVGDFPAVDLVINATSLGMTNCPWPTLDVSQLPKSASVFDMVYEPVQTPLLIQAQRRGLSTIDGLTMLINQATEAFSVFFHRGYPGDSIPQLRALLTS